MPEWEPGRGSRRRLRVQVVDLHRIQYVNDQFNLRILHGFLRRQATRRSLPLTLDYQNYRLTRQDGDSVGDFLADLRAEFAILRRLRGSLARNFHAYGT